MFEQDFVDDMAFQSHSVCGLRALERFPFLLISIGNNDVGAFFEKRRSYRVPQAAGAAGDQNYVALESRAHRHTSEITFSAYLEPRSAILVEHGHVIHRFVRGVWRRGRSSRFDGRRLSRRRYRHGSIRKTESSRANEDRFERFPFRQRRVDGRHGRAKRSGPGGVRFPRLPATGRIRGWNAWGTQL